MLTTLQSKTSAQLLYDAMREYNTNEVKRILESDKPNLEEVPLEGNMGILMVLFCNYMNDNRLENAPAVKDITDLLLTAYSHHISTKEKDFAFYCAGLCSMSNYEIFALLLQRCNKEISNAGEVLKNLLGKFKDDKHYFVKLLIVYCSERISIDDKYEAILLCLKSSECFCEEVIHLLQTEAVMRKISNEPETLVSLVQYFNSPKVTPSQLKAYNALLLQNCGQVVYLPSNPQKQQANIELSGNQREQPNRKWRRTM